MIGSKHARALLTVVGFSALAAIALARISPAYAEQTLHSFSCPQAQSADGCFPLSGLIADRAGNLYGTTSLGGLGGHRCGWNGESLCGTVFKLAPDGTETLLHAFDGNDGSTPVASLIADSAGNLYGTTLFGGTYNTGKVFKIAPDGTATVIYSFESPGDGWQPAAGLIMGPHGLLFGTTEVGGNVEADCMGPSLGCGTVFEVTPNGDGHVLHAFQGGTDGALPLAGLVVDKSGNLYGTTTSGGNGNSCLYDLLHCGTVFKVSPDGTESVLHVFGIGSYGSYNDSDGYYPEGSLVFDKAGNLYGTTPFGGTFRMGTVFRIAPDGTETILHSFEGGTDGSFPVAALVMDKAGNLYGTTELGGASCTEGGDCGTVFKIAPDGSESVLYAFKGARGSGSFATLLLRNGYLYGTAEVGGAHNQGVVFKLKK